MLWMIAIVIALHMSLVWVWYRLKNNPSVVDVGWASGLTLCGLILLNYQGITARSLVLSMTLLLWGLRLGFYLWLTRIRLGVVDKRYTQLSENWKINKKLGFFLNFQLQGVLIYVMSAPWYFAGLDPLVKLHWLDIIAVMLAISAIGFESLADRQLQTFKRVHKGEVCNQGLWQYSRHPNYFFEWLAWCAFSLFGLSHAWGWLGFISPIVLYLLMVKVTGPMTEAGSIQSRGEAYLAYQRKTPMFFPAIFRRTSA